MVRNRLSGGIRNGSHRRRCFFFGGAPTGNDRLQRSQSDGCRIVHDWIREDEVGAWNIGLFLGRGRPLNTTRMLVSIVNDVVGPVIRGPSSSLERIPSSAARFLTSFETWRPFIHFKQSIFPGHHGQRPEHHETTNFHYAGEHQGAAMLWHIQDGGLDGIKARNPTAVVIMIGTNNRGEPANEGRDTAQGVLAI